MRQLTFATRIAKWFGRVGIAEAFPLSKPEKATEGSKLSGNACFGVLSLMQCSDVGPQILRRQFAWSGNSAKSVLEVFNQDLKVFAVGLDRKFRRIAFMSR